MYGLFTVIVILAICSVTRSFEFETVRHAAPVKVIMESTKYENISPALLENDNSLRLPRCGDWYNSNTGGIFYKPFEEVFDNERCVWIIGSPDAVGYTINIQFLGPPTNQAESGQDLIITGVRHGGVSNPIFTSYQPSSTGTFTVEDANIVIVTFYSAEQSDGTQRTGFSMQYGIVETGNITKTSPLSTHHVLESPTFEFKYPTVGTTYSSLELSALVFAPADHFYKCNEKQVWYKRSALEPGCRDALYVYKLNVNAPSLQGKWQADGSICNETSLQITYEDVVLTLFQSDASDQAAGFWFWFMGC